MKIRNTALEIDDLTVVYDKTPVLENVNLKIPKGELCAIIGPNGAGKTTLIKAILSLIKPVSGRVRFNSLSDKSKKIAYVPQSETLDWTFPTTVLDVVMMGSYGKLGLFHRPRKTEREQAMLKLASVGMAEFANRQIGKLSGGQRQRVLLARALLQEAEIYFMDEPFKGVDATTEKAILQLLQRLKAENKTVVVVHHDLQTVQKYFGWVVLVDTKILANGATQAVFDDKNFKQLYSGKAFLCKQ